MVVVGVSDILLINARNVLDFLLLRPKSGASLAKLYETSFASESISSMHFRPMNRKA